jgi:hypothetical protein
VLRRTCSGLFEDEDTILVLGCMCGFSSEKLVLRVFFVSRFISFEDTPNRNITLANVQRAFYHE